MKYRKYSARKFYETWHGKSCGCHIYIYKLPHKDIYHFSVICPNGFIYASLEDNVLYYTFEDIDKAIDEWLDKNLRKG